MSEAYATIELLHMRVANDASDQQMCQVLTGACNCRVDRPKGLEEMMEGVLQNASMHSSVYRNDGGCCKGQPACIAALEDNEGDAGVNA